MNSFRNHRLRDFAVSRPLTLLALYQHGYEVGRYLSLERLVEEAKEDYYLHLRSNSFRSFPNCSSPAPPD